MNSIFPEEGNEDLTLKDCSALLQAVGKTALVSETDDKGNIIYVNEKFMAVAKYSREELIGQNHRILKSGDQPQEMFDELWRTISAGKVWQGEIKNRAKDGTYYWVDTSIAPVLNGQGKPEKYIAVRFVITDKKEFEQNLIFQNIELEKTKKAMLNVLEDVQDQKIKAQSLARDLVKYKVALDGTSDHVMITDPNGIILYANTAIERITGFTPVEVIGKKAGTRELWGGQMGQEFYAGLWHTIKVDKKPLSGEITNRRKDGSMYQALISISPIIYEGELEFLVGIERDITREKEIDRMKTEFISLASHQLRTPLSAMKWFSEMLLAGDAGALNPEQLEFIKNISDSNERMIDLVNSLLNISRIESGRIIIDPRPTDLLELIREIINELQKKITDKKLQLILSIPPDMPQFNIDPKMIRQVYINLLTNAIKYTNSGGEIRVLISRTDADIITQVTDNGVGIPKAEQSKVFDRFFRATNIVRIETDGTGLGLYLAKAIVESSAGKIWFKSEEGQGTTFWFSLPVTGMPAKSGEVSLTP